MANPAYESLAAEAAAHLAKSTSTVENLGGGENEIRRQADCLVAWARERGVFLADDYTERLERREFETTEHEVFYREADNRVVKCTYAGSFGSTHGPKGKPRRATPLSYLQRLELMNQEFPTDLRLEGIALRRPRDGGNEKKPSLVTSQSWVDAIAENDAHPSEQEIADLMTFLGFRRLEDSCYRWFRESDGIIVSDTKPDNFIKSHEGVVPIDLIISRVTTDNQ